MYYQIVCFCPYVDVKLLNQLDRFLKEKKAKICLLTAAFVGGGVGCGRLFACRPIVLNP